MLRNPKALYTTTEFERTNVIVVERQKKYKDGSWCKPKSCVMDNQQPICRMAKGSETKKMEHPAGKQDEDIVHIVMKVTIQIFRIFCISVYMGFCIFMILLRGRLCCLHKIRKIDLG